MRTIRELFTEAKIITKKNEFKYSYTNSLAFMYLSGKITPDEAEKVETYFQNMNIDMMTVANIFESNEIKGL